MYANQTERSLRSFETNTRSLASKGSSSLSLIWSRGIDQNNESSVLKNTQEADGVITARYTCKAPYILLISYNPQITDHRQIQQIYYQSMELDAIDFVQRQ